MNIGKKIVSVAAAAVMCAAVAAAPVSAAEYKVSAAQVCVSEAASNSHLSTYKKEFGVSYSSGFVKKLKSVSSKKAKQSTVFSKSRTGKMFSKVQKSFMDNKSFVFAMGNNEIFSALSVRGDDTRFVICSEEMCLNIYIADNKEMYICDPDSKEAIFMDNYEGAMNTGGDSLQSSSPLNNTAPDLAEDTKGSVYKFTYNNKNYVYECFTDETGNTIGFAFNSKGTPVMIYSEGEYYGCRLSSATKSSWFKVPSDYTVKSMDEAMAEYME